MSFLRDFSAPKTSQNKEIPLCSSKNHPQMVYVIWNIWRGRYNPISIDFLEHNGDKYLITTYDGLQDNFHSILPD